MVMSMVMVMAIYLKILKRMKKLHNFLKTINSKKLILQSKLINNNFTVSILLKLKNLLLNLMKIVYHLNLIKNKRFTN